MQAVQGSLFETVMYSINFRGIGVGIGVVVWPLVVVVRLAAAVIEDLAVGALVAVAIFLCLTGA